APITLNSSISISFSIVDDHRQIRLEVFGLALLPVVQSHFEEPLPAHVELNQPKVGNVGRGRRKAFRTRRDNAQSRQAPRTIGMKKHRTLDRISRERLILLLARARRMN